MKKIGSYLFWSGALIFAIVIAFLIIRSKQNSSIEQKNNTDNQSIILFYGDNCPHCAEVEKYITENNIKEKVNLIEKEVYKNADNAKLLEEKAKSCGIRGTDIGVPFLWLPQGNCYMGNDDVIKIFNDKINGK